MKTMMKMKEANSMNMEKMNMLYDTIMMMMMMTMTTILYMMKMMMKNKYINKMMMENQILEMMWITKPMTMIFMFSYMSIKTLYLNNETKMNIINIKIISNQWFWYYEYMNFNNIKFNSYIKMKMKFNMLFMETDNYMVIPFNYQIQMIITSMDVIHSWTIPSLNIKLDSIPNNLNNSIMMMNKPKIVFGQCSEICGMNHSFMPITLETINLKNFIKWTKMF